MDHPRARELFSDEIDGVLGPALGSDLRAHLASCPECRALFDTTRLVVATLREAAVAPEAPAGLAARAAEAALEKGRRAASGSQTLVAMPRWLLATAAAIAVAVGAGTIRFASDGQPGRFVLRTRDRIVAAGVQLLERKERMAEDLRLMRLVLGTAFEERVDRVSDRVDDYRLLLEKRRSETAPKENKEPAKKSSGSDGTTFSNSKAAARVGPDVQRLNNAGPDCEVPRSV